MTDYDTPHHYRRGLIDGLRAAVALACPYCAQGETPSEGPYHLDGWYLCPAKRITARIAEEVRLDLPG